MAWPLQVQQMAARRAVAFVTGARRWDAPILDGHTEGVVGHNQRRSMQESSFFGRGGGGRARAGGGHVGGA